MNDSGVSFLKNREYLAIPLSFLTKNKTILPDRVFSPAYFFIKSKITVVCSDFFGLNSKETNPLQSESFKLFLKFLLLNSTTHFAHLTNSNYTQHISSIALQ